MMDLQKGEEGVGECECECECVCVCVRACVLEEGGKGRGWKGETPRPKQRFI